VACSYRQSWDALVPYDGDGNILWDSGGLLDKHAFICVPIMQMDGSLAPFSVTLAQASVVGGKAISANVTLNAAVPTGGVAVSLSSSNPSVAAVSATVTMAAGTRSSKSSIATSAVVSQILVTITAAYQGNGAGATLTVKP